MAGDATPHVYMCHVPGLLVEMTWISSDYDSGMVLPVYMCHCENRCSRSCFRFTLRQVSAAQAAAVMSVLVLFLLYRWLTFRPAATTAFLLIDAGPLQNPVGGFSPVEMPDLPLLMLLPTFKFHLIHLR